MSSGVNTAEGAFQTLQVYGYHKEAPPFEGQNSINHLCKPKPVMITSEHSLLRNYNHYEEGEEEEEETENGNSCFADMISWTVDTCRVGKTPCYLWGSLRGAKTTDHRAHPRPICYDYSQLKTKFKLKSVPFLLLSPASRSENQVFHGQKTWKSKTWRVRAGIVLEREPENRLLAHTPHPRGQTFCNVTACLI